MNNVITPKSKHIHSKPNLFKPILIFSIILLLASTDFFISVLKNINSKLEIIINSTKGIETHCDNCGVTIIPTTIPTKEIINEVTPTITPVSTTSWKTYEFYGNTSIKHPSNWVVKRIGEGDAYCFFNDPTDHFCDISISLKNFTYEFFNPNKKSFEEIMADEIKNSDEGNYTRRININGLKAYERQSGYPSYEIVFLGKNDIVYGISFSPNNSKPEDTDIKWKIISTFEDK